MLLNRKDYVSSNLVVIIVYLGCVKLKFFFYKCYLDLFSLDFFLKMFEIILLVWDFLMVIKRNSRELNLWN